MIAFTFDPWQYVQLGVAVVLPVLVGLVTTRATRPGLKAWLLAGLAMVSSLGTEALTAHSEGTTYDLGQGLITALATFIIAVAMHYGLWKPTGTSAVLQHVGAGEVAVLTDVTNDDGPAPEHHNHVHLGEPSAMGSEGEVVESSVVDEAELPGDWSGADDESVDPDEPAGRPYKAEH